MLSVAGLLIIAAFICTIASAWNPSKVPLWISVLLIVVVLLLGVLPLR